MGLCFKTWGLASLLCLALSGAVGPLNVQPAWAQPAAKGAEVDPTALADALKAKNPPFLIDVREPDEYESGHIAGALSIPLRALPDRLSEVPKDRPVVVYCRSGHRSGMAQAFLEQQGYTNITSMTGGVLSWHAGLLKGSCATSSHC